MSAGRRVGTREGPEKLRTARAPLDTMQMQPRHIVAARGAPFMVRPTVSSPLLSLPPSSRTCSRLLTCVPAPPDLSSLSNASLSLELLSRPHVLLELWRCGGNAALSSRSPCMFFGFQSGLLQFPTFVFGIIIRFLTTVSVV
ncbi:hypothetical protein BT93_A0675 [Corymbia citriodora subsp. variegata]|nr:hypothetical protein BT93_A0675 [Corymbia citriodora subsp. variegata]